MNDKSITEISPLAAWKILQSEPRATVLDVRTSMEYEYVGHPVGAINVPWQKLPGGEVNGDFVADVCKTLSAKHGEDADILSLPLLMICRSGKRSRAAADKLINHDFKKVFNIDEGFEGDLDEEKHRGRINGWRYHGLPWEQT